MSRACAILDLEGVDALTLRRLANDLGVGVTSMYWHVDDKGELLDLCFRATFEPVVSEVLARAVDPADWSTGLRAMLAGLFDVMEDHPWLAELAAAPQSPQRRGEAVTRVWDRIGTISTSSSPASPPSFRPGARHTRTDASDRHRGRTIRQRSGDRGQRSDTAGAVVARYNLGLAGEPAARHIQGVEQRGDTRDSRTRGRSPLRALESAGVRDGLGGASSGIS